MSVSSLKTVTNNCF